MEEVKKMNEREEFFMEGGQLSMFPDDGLKLVNRISFNGNAGSESFSIQLPKEQTIRWDTDEYEIKSLKPGELIIERKGEGK